MTDIRVPSLGESVTEATVGQWFKQAGDAIKVDEPIVELETDKVTIEVPAPASGHLADIVVKQGETVNVGSVLGSIQAGDGAPAKQAEPAPAEPAAPQPATSAEAPAPEPEKPTPPASARAEAPKSKPLAREPSPREEVTEDAPKKPPSGNGMPPSPSARKALSEAGMAPDDVSGSGRRGQVLKEDVSREQEARSAARSAELLTQPRAESAPRQEARAPVAPQDETREERVRMTKLRQTIARRLKEAQSNAAMLTTFNDVDMSRVLALRNSYKELFEKKHGVRLGFMGFFVKACVQALKEVPEVNAEIDGTDLVYKNYYHIGVAVGTERGLVVPVVRDADRMSVAEVERRIHDFGVKARDGKLALEDMQGGTFTISNGGVFGSLMSTPILNAPQSGILGMHRIEERPVVRDGEIVARPMMYLALSYDHRVVDGQGAVTFLVRVKQCLEDPERLVLEL